MLKKAILLGLIILYLYFHTFNIFLNKYFFIPTPLIFGLPLIILFKEKIANFLYFKEVLFLLIANFSYYFIAQSDSKTFSVNAIIIIICALFFNYCIGFNKQRLHSSIYVFYCLLLLSTIIMFLNHIYPDRINVLRSQLIGGDITQSQTGITTAKFNYGYQLAALVGFAFINTIVFNRKILVKIFTLAFCLLAIYFGLQRSVLFDFACVILIFALAYYKLKAIPFIFLIGLFSILFSMYFLQENANNYDNIFAKNERNSEENRSDLVKENLKIVTDYPYGLVFYGKTWDQVTRNNRTFSGGLTSHNAYLMFLTYLGPFIGSILLVLVYYKVGSIFKHTVVHITEKENAMMACLCFSFLSASLNSLFHNAWFIGANGSMVFTYFAILQLRNQQIFDESQIQELEAI